jgi:AcrR family transcriptional regulator
MSPVGRPARRTAEEWAQGALDTIETDGVPGLTVEAVARRLGVSKGGCYHRFEDRRALLRAALALWEERFVDGITERFSAIADPRERLHALLHHAAVEMQPTVITKLIAASDDPDVAAALSRAADSRLSLLERLFGDLGLPRATARERALLAYSAYLGLAQLREHASPGLRTPRRLRTYLDEVEALLATGAGDRGASPILA